MLLGQTQLNADVWSDSRQLIDIEEIKIHDKYDGTSAYCDIGLIFLKNDINFSEGIAPICLPDQPFESKHLISKECGLVGWGKDGDEKSVNPYDITLSISLLQVYTQDKCNKKYDISGQSNVAKDSKTMLPNLFTEQTFCAGSEVRFFLHVKTLKS